MNNFFRKIKLKQIIINKCHVQKVQLKNFCFFNNLINYFEKYNLKKASSLTNSNKFVSNSLIKKKLIYHLDPIEEFVSKDK